MKKKIAVSAVLVLCLSMLIYSTVAYFNTADTARNVITTGDIKIELQETAIKDGQEIPFKESTEIYDVVPGQAVSKIVRVENTGSNAAYIRIDVKKAIALDADAQGEIDLDLISLDFDNENWTLGNDGYYYYNKPLAPGETTTALFNNVTFDPKMGNIYQGSTATITVKAQATQVKNNGTDVFSAAGWPDADTSGQDSQTSGSSSSSASGSGSDTSAVGRE